MISGALLAAYCPDNGQCNAPGGEGGPGRRLLQAAARALGVGGDEPPVSECNGRALWLIVGCITLSSPLLILLTQVGPKPLQVASCTPLLCSHVSLRTGVARVLLAWRWCRGCQQCGAALACSCRSWCFSAVRNATCRPPGRPRHEQCSPCAAQQQALLAGGFVVVN